MRNEVAHELAPRDSVVFVAGEHYQLVDVSQDFEFLDVRVAGQTS